MAVRGLRCRVLAMISWRGTPCSPRWVAAEWLEFPAGVLAEQHPGAVVAEPGSSGGGAQVFGAGPAGRAGSAFGEEHRAGFAAADEAGQQVGGAGAPVNPFGVAALERIGARRTSRSRSSMFSARTSLARAAVSSHTAAATAPSLVAARPCGSAVAGSRPARAPGSRRRAPVAALAMPASLEPVS